MMKMTDKQQELESLKTQLDALGWKIGPQSYMDTGVSWYAWKLLERDSVTADCQFNDKPPNIVITPYYLNTPNKDGLFEYTSVEFDLTAQTFSRLWVDFKLYSVQVSECITRIPLATKILTQVWNVAATEE